MEKIIKKRGGFLAIFALVFMFIVIMILASINYRADSAYRRIVRNQNQTQENS